MTDPDATRARVAAIRRGGYPTCVWTWHPPIRTAGRRVLFAGWWETQMSRGHLAPRARRYHQA